MQEIKSLDFHIKELDSMKKYPKELFYIGNLELLKKRKIGIIGSRNPSTYAVNCTYQIVNAISNDDNIIVSGGALGIDTVAHKACKDFKTIMVSGTGLDKRYPSINRTLIENIEQNGLVISQFPINTPSFPKNFVIRNEIIVALSDILIVPYANLQSGSQRSIDFALKMGKKIYVLPHRIGESEATNKLLQENKATAIYSIDDFIKEFVDNTNVQKDDFLEYCKTNPNYDEAALKYGDKVFEYELLGKIKISNGKVLVLG